MDIEEKLSLISQLDRVDFTCLIPRSSYHIHVQVWHWQAEELVYSNSHGKIYFHSYGNDAKNIKHNNSTQQSRLICISGFKINIFDSRMGELSLENMLEVEPMELKLRSSNQHPMDNNRHLPTKWRPLNSLDNNYAVNPVFGN